MIHSLVGTSLNTIKKYIRIWNGLEMVTKNFLPEMIRNSQYFSLLILLYLLRIPEESIIFTVARTN
ncbi:hypothetical protein BAX98_08795 [Elizabethkingia anophelis]|nr:hypothetical protein BAX98_08795 [Elizabethkingia anophelis]